MSQCSSPNDHGNTLIPVTTPFRSELVEAVEVGHEIAL